MAPARPEMRQLLRKRTNTEPMHGKKRRNDQKTTACSRYAKTPDCLNSVQLLKFFAPKPHSTSTLSASHIRQLLTGGVNR